MQRSEQVGELIAALAKAQQEYTSAIKDVTNNAFGNGRAYKYADLAANIGAVRPSLSKHGIALIQFNETDLERQTASVTTALHFGEQWISETAEAPATGRNGFDVQSIGACWTYLRRYTLQAICGLASEDDDASDLAGANNQPIPAKGKQQPSKQEPAYASQEPGMHDEPPAQATEQSTASNVRSRFFGVAKEAGWSMPAVKHLLTALFNEFNMAKLSVEQLAKAVKIMKSGNPDEVLANLDQYNF